MQHLRSRIDLAKKRVVSILTKRRYANTRQLESKISESGPLKTAEKASMRCDPHIITHALRDLKAEGVIQQDGQFFFLSRHMKTDLKRRQVEARKRIIGPLYNSYIELASHTPDACGHVLEDVLETALLNSPEHRLVDSRRNKKRLELFGTRKIRGPVDAVSILETRAKSITLLFEAKNIREWIYPDSHELWSLIEKANTLSGSDYHPLPVLICRKIPYYCFAAFKALGVYGFQTHHQLFHPDYEKQLANITHTDALGFHDISTELTPSPHLYRFLQVHLPNHALRYSDKFIENKALFDDVAATMARKDLVAEKRKELWAATKRKLGIYDHLSKYE